MTALAEVRAALVMANRILVQKQVLDGFGHVSARHPLRPDRFLLAKRVAPALVREDDLIEFGFDGEPAEQRDAPTFLERYIHSAIYAQRADVQSIVHSHAAGIVAVGLVREAPFRAVCHTCGFLKHPVPVFEIRDSVGDASDLLISTQALGAALAKSLGDSAVVLMRGHGYTATGSSVSQAVYRAVYSEINARIQIAASTLGSPAYLTSEEADACEATSTLQAERNWAFWCDDVARSNPGRSS